MTDSTWTGSYSDIHFIRPQGDYNYFGNWSPGAVPDGTASFGVSDVTNIFIEASLNVGTWHFLPGASQYNFIVGGPPNYGNIHFSTGIFIEGGSCHILNYNGVFFDGTSSTGAASIDNFSFVAFGSSPTDTCTAGNSTITNERGALTSFAAFSQAGNATIVTLSGGATEFYFNSTGGNAQFITEAGGFVDFSPSKGPDGLGHIAAGSIAGAGTYKLGSDALSVGSNGLATSVSGLITDGGIFGGSGASLHKVGAGMLTLSHADNGYTGGTFLAAGALDLAAVGAAGPGAITFDGTAALELANAALSHHALGNPIDDFAHHDVIDLTGLKFHAGAAATYHPGSHRLTVHSGTVTDTLMLVSPAGTHFHVAKDAHTGTKVTLASASLHALALDGRDWGAAHPATDLADGSHPAAHAADFLFAA
jgi:autotransporter-associated beta strand protein